MLIYVLTIILLPILQFQHITKIGIYKPFVVSVPSIQLCVCACVCGVCVCVCVCVWGGGGGGGGRQGIINDKTCWTDNRYYVDKNTEWLHQELVTYPNLLIRQ